MIHREQVFRGAAVALGEMILIPILRTRVTAAVVDRGAWLDALLEPVAVLVRSGGGQTLLPLVAGVDADDLEMPELGGAQPEKGSRSRISRIPELS